MITLEQWCKDNNKENLLNEWDWDSNVGLTPDAVAVGYKNKVSWICSSCGNRWMSLIANRARNGRGCPVCANKMSGERMRQRRLLNGTNSLAVVNPELLSEWDYSMNGGIDPNEVNSQSHMNVNWICKNGHRFKSRIQNRMLGSKCPYCSGKIPVEGVNDLKTTNPEILDEWDYSKNTILPEHVKAGSERKVYWIGKCGHSYIQMIANHVKGHGCSICAGKTVVAGINDLESRYPEIAIEWDFEKNNILPSQISEHSNKKVWWKCQRGHSYGAIVEARTGSQRSGCPICAKETKTSFPEQAIYFYVIKIFTDATSCDRRYKKELDIYIPSIKTAIEYDGKYWHGNHRSLKKDNDKDEFCKNKGIRLIRFRDISLPDTEYAERITCKDADNNSLQEGIKALFVLLGSPCPNINISNDTTLIMSSYVVNQKNNSLLNMYPEIAKEWHPTKNGDIRPDVVTWASAKKVWWKCSSCEAEWVSSIHVRTGEQAQGCPVCTKKKVKKEKSSAVRNIETGEVFDSITLAATSCGGRIGDISAVCHGRQKTAFGFHWEYVIGPQTSRYKYTGKVQNVDNEMVFESLADAAKWCNGRIMNISACCRGRQKTAYGFRWKFIDG